MLNSNRLLFVATFAFMAAAFTQGTKAQPSEPLLKSDEIIPWPSVPTPWPDRSTEPPLHWHDVTHWGVEGRAFGDLARQRWFDRLPCVAEGKVSAAVWGYSRDSAGMMVRFKTDASTIWVDYTLRNQLLALPNVIATGASGIDLYARDDSGKWRWVGVTIPEQKVVRQAIVADLAPDLREYAAYLPLYNGVGNLSIGVPPGAKFEPLAPRTAKPILFYGTSITQGASASRPGMACPAILGRRLERPVINFGFAGAGRMDAAVGELLVKIDAGVYVIDCVPNMSAPEIREKCIPLVKQLRAGRPDVPIILVEDRRHASAWIQPKRNQSCTDAHTALRTCFDQLQKEGLNRLYYLPDDDLTGHGEDGTTDGIHPSDLGMVWRADQFEPILRKALGM